jgi:hypothetical protein
MGSHVLARRKFCDVAVFILQALGLLKVCLANHFPLEIIKICKNTYDIQRSAHERTGYALKAGQLTYDCRYSTMHGMPVTGGRGFRGLKPLWYNGVPP